jgi:hypothetical protein
MVAVTYGTARVAAGKTGRAAPDSGRKNVGKNTFKNAFFRFIHALEAARMRQAERELARYGHLLALKPLDFSAPRHASKTKLPRK